jgi:hydrogenase maturation protein HypF
MFPNLKTVQQHCQVSDLEAQLLRSPQAPIVLLHCDNQGNLGKSVSPNNPNLGVMLPYTPLHHLLMAKLGFPIVATSANLADEPICIEENEALNRLNDIADLFLIHDRPILRAVDDSVVRVIADRPLILRPARGYAPLPILINQDLPPTLAVGGHFKNTMAIAQHQQIFLSQHIGDLATPQSYQAFQEVIASLSSIYDFTPQRVVCDLHPDYISTQWAEKLNLPLTRVQHHQAHVYACIADNHIKPPVLGVAWDGTGYGEDGTIWGGEFFLVTENDCIRVAHLRQFYLPGGEKAVKEPRRSAIGLLYEIWGEEFLSPLSPPLVRGVGGDRTPFLRGVRKDLVQIYQKMLNNGLNSPKTSSMGRFFDGIASLLDIRQEVSFEGQAAMELEFLLRDNINQKYSFIIRDNHPLIIDFEPIILGIIEDIKLNTDRSIISAKFHNTLAAIIVAIAQKINIKQVLLTGGCFQNKYLTETAIFQLQKANFIPFWHKNIPPNDGGIALGQVIMNKTSFLKS